MLQNLPSEKRKCHHCFFRKSCRDLVLSGACERWVEIKGTHPQTGEYLEQWGCIDDMQHLLLLEIGNQTSKASIETNQLRNEVKKSHDENMVMAAVAVQRSQKAIRDTMGESLSVAIQRATDNVLASSNPQLLIARSAPDTPVDKSNGS